MVLAFGLVFFRVPYIGHTVAGNELGTLACEALFAAGLFAFYFSRGVTLFRRELFILLIYALWVAFLTLLNGHSPVRFLYEYAPAFFLVLYFSIVRPEEETLRVLKAWIVFLTVLLLTDLATMALFPGGLYQSENYSENWFLGYKTYRLNITIPLVVFAAYVQLAESGKTKKSLFFLQGLVLLDTVLCRGTASVITVSAFLFFLDLFLFFRSAVPSGARRFRRAVYSPFVFEILYAVIVVTVLNLRYNELFTRFMLRVVHKTPTISGRTVIWEYTLDVLRQNGWKGMGYLNGAQFIELLHGLNNPHNFVLSLLVYGGIAGLVIFLVFLNSVLLGSARCDCNAVVIMALYAFLLLGTVSSSFITAPLFYCMLMLLMSMSKENHVLNGAGL